MTRLRFTEPRSGLDTLAATLPDLAPDNVAWLVAAASPGLEVAAIHAMWTGPEISAPVPTSLLPDHLATVELPLENATVTPQPGDIMLQWLPARMWGGGPSPVFDVGLYYGPGARCFFPIGWQPGSVVGRVATSDIPRFAEACAAIRRNGACTLRIALA